MPHTLFIADLHLSPDRPDITACLEDFLNQQATQAEALYVLGDLFEYWIGDDDINPFTTGIAQAFKALNDKGIPIYFIHGNRDFLIRQAFAKRAGITLLPEQQVIDLYGTPTLIMHGDELCTLDVSYQKFRNKARSWWWPRMVLCLPLSSRRKIAENGRKKSQKKQQGIAEEITDVTQQEVVTSLQRHQVLNLIHGHTHKPAVHHFEIDGKAAQRIVLGDWYTQGSILTVDAEGAALQTLAFKH